MFKITNPTSKLASLTALLVWVGLFMLPITVAAQGNIVASYGEKFLFEFVNTVFGKLAGSAGVLLDFAINNFITGFGKMFTEGGLGFAVESLWVIVRDIFNLTFIFGLVFIGLKMIFDSSDSGSRKLLVTLILAALLVNFSLFITKFVIDFSNIAAVQFSEGFKKDANGGVDVSEAFSQAMNLSTIQKMDAEAFQTTFSGGGGMGFIIGQLIVYIISIYVFLGGALLIMIRFVILNIYMILSPLMFLGWVFPSAAGVSKDYWKGFLSRAFFAPAYLLMLYFTLTIMNSYKTIFPKGGSLADAFNSKSTPATIETVLPPFMLTAIFLIASIVVAQKMSATGGSAIISAQGAMMNKIRGGVTGGSKWIGRNASPVTPIAALTRTGLNRGGMRLKKGFNSSQAKLQSAAQDKDASRLTKVAAWTASTNLVDRAFRGSASKLENAELLSGTTYAKEDAYQSTVQSNINKKQKELDRKQKISDFAARSKGIQNPVEAKLAALRLKRTKDKNSLSPEENAELMKLEQAEQKLISAITAMTTADLEEMGDDITDIAAYLSHSQVENINKSDKIGPGLKDKIGTARKEAIKQALTDGSTIFTAELAKLSIEQIESLGDDWIRDNVQHFSSAQMDDLKKSKKFTESQRNNFTDIRSTAHKAAIADNTTAENLFKHTGRDPRKSRKKEDIISLGADVLVQKNAVPFLTSDVLEELVNKKTLTFTQRQELVALILNPANGAKADVLQYLQTPKGAKDWGLAQGGTNNGPLNINTPPGYTTSPGGVILPNAAGNGPRPQQP